MSEALAKALLPCPFCGDPMRRLGHGKVVHSNRINRGECIIGVNGFLENAWNTRAAEVAAAPALSDFGKSFAATVEAFDSLPAASQIDHYRTKAKADAAALTAATERAERLRAALVRSWNELARLSGLPSPAASPEPGPAVRVSISSDGVTWQDAIPAASPEPWSLPPEADRPDGFACLAQISNGWCHAVWRSGRWTEYFDGIAIGPNAFAPLPSAPAREGDAT